MTTKRIPLSKKQRAELFLAQGGKCAICWKPMRAGHYHDDHKLALIDGGTNELSNRRLICVKCHQPKSAREHKANSKAKRLAQGGRWPKRRMNERWTPNVRDINDE